MTLPTMIFWGCVFCVLCVYARKWRASKPLAWGLLSAAFIALLLVSLSSSLKNPHHSVQALMLVCAAVAVMVSSYERTRWARLLLFLAAGTQLFTAVYMSTLTPHKRASADIWKVSALLDDAQLAQKTLLVGTGWGTQFIYSLYGPKERLFLWQDILDEDSVAKIREIAQRTGRRIVVIDGPFLYRPSSVIRQYFPELRVVYPKVRGSSDIYLWSQAPLLP
jgi:hypothetical protein